MCGLQVITDDKSTVLREGELKKLGGTLLNKWNVRWFVLTGSQVMYFESAKDAVSGRSPKTVIKLTDIREVGEVTDEPNEFYIITTAGRTFQVGLALCKCRRGCDERHAGIGRRLFFSLESSVLIASMVVAMDVVEAVAVHVAVLVCIRCSFVRQMAKSVMPGSRRLRQRLHWWRCSSSVASVWCTSTTWYSFACICANTHLPGHGSLCPHPGNV